MSFYHISGTLNAFLQKTSTLTDASRDHVSRLLPVRAVSSRPSSSCGDLVFHVSWKGASSRLRVRKAGCLPSASFTENLSTSQGPPGAVHIASGLTWFCLRPGHIQTWIQGVPGRAATSADATRRRSGLASGPRQLKLRDGPRVQRTSPNSYARCHSDHRV